MGTLFYPIIAGNFMKPLQKLRINSNNAGCERKSAETGNRQETSTSLFLRYRGMIRFRPLLQKTNCI